MATLLSPGVNVREFDFSQIIPSLGNSSGALVGQFDWGPAEDVTVIGTEDDLIKNFGKPKDFNYIDWFCAANFLSYTNNLNVVRVISDDALNATPNKMHYDITTPTGNKNLLGFSANLDDSSYWNTNNGLLKRNDELEDLPVSGVGPSFIFAERGDDKPTPEIHRVYTKEILNDDGESIAFSFYTSKIDGNRNPKVELISNVAGYSAAATFMLNGANIGTPRYESVGIKTNIDDVTFGMEDLENGWYRCSIIMENLPAHSTWQLIITNSLNDGNTYWHTGHGSTSLTGHNSWRIFAPQLEVSSEVTDYVPTTFYKSTGTVELLDIPPSNPADIGQGFLIKNDQIFDYIKNDSSLNELMFVAKYPGDIGNSIKVSMADKASFKTWKYKEYFDTAPDTSRYAEDHQSSDDELHIVVIDEEGVFTGTPNSILETYPFLSKASDARGTDNTNIFYGNVINERSRFVRYVGPVTNDRLRNSSKIKEIKLLTSGSGYNKETVRVEINGDGVDAYVDPKDIKFASGGITSDNIGIVPITSDNADSRIRFIRKEYHAGDTITPPAKDMYIPLQFQTGYGRDFTSRASIGTFVNSAGNIATAAIDIERIHYNTENLSLAPISLMENAATNLITYSNNQGITTNLLNSNYSRSNWTENTLVTNVANPTGALSTWLIKPKQNLGNSQYIIRTGYFTTSPNTISTFSFWAKPDGTSSHEADNSVHIVLSNSGWLESIRVTVDLRTTATSIVPTGFEHRTTGTVVTVPAANYSATCKIEHFKNGWKRISVSGKCGTIDGANEGHIYLRRAIGSTPNITTGGIYLFGMQVEAGPVATSYIETTTASVTRSADVYGSPNNNSYAAYIKTRAIDGWVDNIIVQTEGASIVNWNNPIEVLPKDVIAGEYVKAYLSPSDFGDPSKAFILRKEPTHAMPRIRFTPVNGQLVTGVRLNSTYFRHSADQRSDVKIPIELPAITGVVPAAGLAHLDRQGFVTKVEMTNTGRNYSGSVVISVPDFVAAASYFGLKIIPTAITGILPVTKFDSGIIDSIKITDGGYDYTEATISIVDNGRPGGQVRLANGTIKEVSPIFGGTGATAVAVLESTGGGSVWDVPAFDSQNKIGRKFRSLKSGYGGTFSFSGGSTGSLCLAGEYLTGWDLFKDPETTDVSLLISGDCGSYSAGSSEANVVSKHIFDNIVGKRKDCVAFYSPLLNLVDGFATNSEKTENVIEYKDSLNISGDLASYAVYDSGWKLQYDKYNEKYRKLPLNADIAGLCAQTDYTNDVWWSPAGYNRGNIKNIVSLLFNPTQTDRDELYKNRINPVVTFKGDGTILFGDRTMLGKTSAFSNINVRRLFLMLEKSISKAAKYQLFEFNDVFTRSSFTSMITERLNTVKAKRGITDFYVQCDATNNTPDVIDRNEFVASIYIKPARSINFITLNFVAVRTGVAFSTVVGEL